MQTKPVTVTGKVVHTIWAKQEWHQGCQFQALGKLSICPSIGCTVGKWQAGRKEDPLPIFSISSWHQHFSGDPHTCPLHLLPDLAPPLLSEHPRTSELGSSPASRSLWVGLPPFYWIQSLSLILDRDRRSGRVTAQGGRRERAEQKEDGLVWEWGCWNHAGVPCLLVCLISWPIVMYFAYFCSHPH